MVISGDYDCIDSLDISASDVFKQLKVTADLCKRFIKLHTMSWRKSFDVTNYQWTKLIFCTVILRNCRWNNSPFVQCAVCSLWRRHLV